MLKESTEVLRKVFDNVDKDKSGYIDSGELRLLAKELGQEISEQDLTEIIAQIDTNKDGKISFEEFCIWWRGGASSKIEKLVYLQLKAQKLLSKAHIGLTRLGQSLETKFDNFDQSYIGIQAGDASNPETSWRTHLGVCLKDESHREHIVNELGINAEDYFVVLSIETPQATALHATLTELWEFAKVVLESSDEAAQVLNMISVNFEVKGDKVLMIVKGDKTAVEMQDQTIQVMVGYMASLNINLQVSAHLDLKTSIKSIIENDGKPFKLLTEGFLVELKANYNKVLSQKLRQGLVKRFAKSFESSGYLNSKKKMLLNLCMLSAIKFVIKLTVPEVDKICEQVGESMGMNPAEQVPSANALLDMGKGLSEGIVQGILGSLPVGEQILSALKSTEMSKIDVYVLAPKSYLHSSLKLPGVKEICERLL